jgi:hypothetical protein
MNLQSLYTVAATKASYADSALLQLATVQSATAGEKADNRAITGTGTLTISGGLVKPTVTQRIDTAASTAVLKGKASGMADLLGDHPWATPITRHSSSDVSTIGSRVHLPKPAATGDVTAKWIEETVGAALFDADPNAIGIPGGNAKPLSPELKAKIEGVVKDIFAKWKPGDDLAGSLRVGVALVLWGAGISPDVIQDVGDRISLFAGYTPAELDHDLANII